VIVFAMIIEIFLGKKDLSAKITRGMWFDVSLFVT
jgi:hypothetical protein